MYQVEDYCTSKDAKARMSMAGAVNEDEMREGNFWRKDVDQVRLREGVQCHSKDFGI